MSDLGLTNNNPTNIRYTGIKWLGLADPPHDANGFCVFSTLQAGLVAGAKDLYNQQRLHGLNTITAIISRLSPPSENNTAIYINRVSAHMGIAPYSALTLSDHTQLSALLAAVVTQEIGAGHVADDQIDTAVEAVLGEPAQVSAAAPLQVEPVVKSMQISSAYTAAGSGAAITLLPYVQWAFDGFHSMPPSNMAALTAAGLATAGHWAYNRWLR